MSIPLYQVDAFSRKPFAGNPAAVVFLPAGDPRTSDARWMQEVAGEMNLAETAFLSPAPEGFGLRWCTPSTEVELCGHATLATAHLRYERGTLEAGREARFHTASGLLTAAQRGEWLELDFPAEPAEAAEAPQELLRALGLPPRFVGRNRLGYLVELEAEEQVRGLRPDLALRAALPGHGGMGTSRARGRDYDFVSRFFAPQIGIAEDPVTGAAHCCLAPYWAARLGKAELTGYQASARGGLVRVRPEGRRVKLGGQAVTVFAGSLLA